MKLLTRAATIAVGGLTLGLSTAASAAITFQSDPILYWNQQTVNGLGLVGGSPLAQTRIYAMVNIAMHDAVNATLGGPNRSYLSGVSAPGGDSRVAASKAARDVLVAMNGANAAQYNAALDAILLDTPDGQAKTDGLATGAAYASKMIDLRTMDGSTAMVSYTTTGLPGDWRPTTPGNPAAPHWGSVDPFVMSRGNQFRADAPPELNSPEYAAAYNEVKALGSSTQGPSDQRNSALFWDASNGSPWVSIGLLIAEDEGLSTIEYARAFALLTTSLADSLIAGFDSKYEYRLWRPQTAIQLGDTDGNDLTEGDAAWQSLFNAPLHPSYVSTHSALSGAGSTVLSSIFGDDKGFTLTIDGASRDFTGLQQAAEDAANSRLWGGIHFSFDNAAGLTMGQQIGQLALRRNIFNAVPEPSTWAMMIGGFGAIGGAMRRRRFRVSFQSAQAASSM